MSEVIERLYGALEARDGDAMAGCYTVDARFQDPVFGVLEGDRVGYMWRMLTEASSGVSVDVSDITFDGDRCSALWVARYVFGPTGRRVVNRASAEYRIDRGLIAEHHDHFSLARWSRQALGFPGLLLGWAPPAQAGIRRRARAGLDRYIAEVG